MPEQNLQYQPRHAVTAIYTAVVAKHRFVNWVGAHATDAADVQGISEMAGGIGKAGSLVTDYSYPVEAAAAIPAGSPVAPASDGTGRAVVATGVQCGRALTAAAAGELVVVRPQLLAGGVSPSKAAALDSLVSTPGNVPALLALLEGGGAGPAQTFANAMVTVAADAGKTTRITNIGKPGVGSLMISDGVNLLPIGGSCPVMRSTIPMIMPPNCTVGANGALTLSVALDSVYSSPSSGNGGCFMYFLAGQVYSGSPAGWYYVSMSSTTAGTIYNNLHTGGWPVPPAVPAGLTTASVGATSSSAGVDITAMSVTLPGGAMGKTGRLRSRFSAICNAAGGGSRFVRGFLAGYNYQIMTTTAANNFSSQIGELVNQGMPNRQRNSSLNSGGGLTGETTYTPSNNTIDTSADQTVSIAMRNSSGSDYLVLLAAEMELVGG